MKNQDLFADHIRRLAPRPTGIRPRMHPRAPLRAMIFAVHGTLFISEGAGIMQAADRSRKLATFEELLRSHGIEQSAETLLQHLTENVNAIKAEKRAKGIDFPEVRIDRIWQDLLSNGDRSLARRLALGCELIFNPPYPMPNLDELFLACRRAGFKLGIISNAQFYTPLLFQHFLGRPPRALGFDPKLIFYSYALGRAKPSATLFEMAADRLQEHGISPESALYVGNDMGNDVCPAHAAGFQTALFAGDKRSLRLRENDPRCRNISPEMVITELDHLRRMV